VPRPAKFTEDQILDSALRLVAEGGPGAATIAGIAGLLGPRSVPYTIGSGHATSC
jgi:AcrR family transcriptional regulator